MNTRRKWLVILGSAVLIIVTPIIFSSSLGAASATTKHLKIGCTLPLSGPAAQVGLTWARGYELAAEWINDQGGIKIGDDAYLIDLIVEDDGFNPEKAVSANTKLVYSDKVKFIIAFVDFLIIPGYQITSSNGVLQVVSFIVEPGGPADVAPDKPLRLRLNLTGTGLQAFNYDYLVKNYPKAKKIVIAVYDQPIHEADIKIGKALAAKHGLQVVGVERFPFTTGDWVPVWTRILAYKPDAVDMAVSNPAHLGYSLKAARGLGFKGPIFKVTPGDPNVIIHLAGSEAATDLFGVGIDVKSPKMPGIMSRITTRWAAKYKEPFTTDAILAWDALWALTQGIQKAQSLEPKVVLNTMEKMTQPGSLQTLQGPAQMGGLKTHGVNRVLVKPVPYTLINNGKVEFIDFDMPVVP